MKRIFIIGAGPGDCSLLTGEAKAIIDGSGCIIAHGRFLKDYADSGKDLVESVDPHEIAARIEAHDAGDVSVLVSGDAGFYSLGKKLAGMLGELSEVKTISGVSSVAYFCARTQSSWDDALLLSLHGRTANVPGKVKRNGKVIMLTDEVCTPNRIASELCENGLEDVVLTVGENLSLEGERITSATAREAAMMRFSGLCVVQAENPRPKEREFIRDCDFIRGDAPMTKQEVRLLSVSKLRLSSRDVVYDVGAGTGSVSVEMALQIPDGTVFALERDEAALKLISENKRRFGAANLQIVSGDAENSMLSLPAPDKAFIGGSGGKLPAILDAIHGKNAAAGVVVNAVTLETLCEAAGYYKGKGGYSLEVIQAGISRAASMGGHRMMKAENPVFIISAEMKGEGS